MPFVVVDFGKKSDVLFTSFDADECYSFIDSYEDEFADLVVFYCVEDVYWL